MSGVQPRYQLGPVTYAAAEAIKGGQLVEARANAVVGVAAAGSTAVVGVAMTDAVPAADQSDATTSYGAPVTDTSVPPGYVSVCITGVIKATYTAAAAFGDLLTTAANGQVTPAGATPTVGTVVGRCLEPAGVAAGARGLMRLGH